MERQLLVATDGSPRAMGALRVAHELARQGVMKPALVLAVEEPVVAYDVAATTELDPDRVVERAGARELREAVEAQLREIGAEGAGWEVTVELGSPAATIADAARERGVDLLVMGLGRRAPVDRLLGGETTLRVMQLAHAPVLAVNTEVRGLPRRAVVADDFSEYSREAGLRALDILLPDGELHLAHVARIPSPGHSAIRLDEWLARYREGIRETLESRREEFAALGRATVHVHALEGDPAMALLELADRIDADLLAAGRHGRGFLGRLLMGSVSNRLVRGARCSALIVPPRYAAKLKDAE